MANFDFLYFIAGIFLVVIILGIIYIIINRAKEKEEPENETIIENYMPQYSKGYSEGVIENIEFGEKRIKIEFYPRDINYIRELKNKNFSLEPITLFFDKRQVIPINISAHRNKLKCFPNDISLLPEEFKQTRFGKKIMEIITENNKLSDESELMQERMNNLQKISSQTFGGEIFSGYVKKTKEQMKDLSENIKKEEKKFGEK